MPHFIPAAASRQLSVDQLFGTDEWRQQSLLLRCDPDPEALKGSGRRRKAMQHVVKLMSR